MGVAGTDSARGTATMRIVERPGSDLNDYEPNTGSGPLHVR